MTVFRIAVIADPHVHDIHADFGQGPVLALRLAADVAKSTRVFNETVPALRHALRDILARGVRHVVLLGDLTDDGQRAEVGALQRLLDAARAAGLTFWAVPGNHDVFADTGRDCSRRMATLVGGHDLFTSDPDRRDPSAGRVLVGPQMRCAGQPEGLLHRVGFFGDPGGLHWETPFGSDPSPETRRYPVWSDDGTVKRYLMDASYLVEPVPGVWLAMVDANVWVPQGDPPTGNADYFDATDAGWPAVLRHKAFLVDWLHDVATRAAAQRKHLLTFSHYPVLDPFVDSRAAEHALLGQTVMARRAPGADVAQALIGAGIGVHFCGHMHLNTTTRYALPGGGLVDVAVPSLAAFPAAYKIVTPGAATQVQTVEIGAMPMPQGVTYAGALAGHDSYGGFLAAHARHLVARRFLRREWPPDLAAAVPGLTLADMTGIAAGRDVPALSVIEDWHLLRMGGPFGRDRIPAGRVAIYRDAAGCQTRWAPLFAMMRSYLDRLPSRDFMIAPRTGAVQAV